MKSGKKALLLALCAVLLVAATVMGTMAYLTSQDQVINTFTIGNIAITLDEAEVDANGTKVEGAERVKANTYKLMPGHEYIKDPTVHVTAGSEDSWIFVEVENGISVFEADTSTAEGGYKTIADQITANDWTALESVPGVYYKDYTKVATNTDLVVFGNFKIDNNANELEGWSGISAVSTKVTVTAYAVQKDGFNTAEEAWNATFGAPVSGN